jgi:hypothetical protein
MFFLQQNPVYFRIDDRVGRRPGCCGEVHLYFFLEYAMNDYKMGTNSGFLPSSIFAIDAELYQHIRESRAKCAG